MFKNLKISLILTTLTIIMFGLGYPFFFIAAGLLIPEKSTGSPVYAEGRIAGFENIGQNFTDDKYFNGRPSAVNYDASATGGSNKGPSNPEYLTEVQARIDTFLIHNPDISKSDIPSDLITASGSGIDPDITPDAAYIQVKRISKNRSVSEEELRQIIKKNTDGKYLGIFGEERINLLKLNIELDKIH
ncbi:MAG TPA: potassium-transporting ATPase subunit KdpC [Ignavibacteria bacterium]|nr:potassium-transporting ATPase subunit KdpC [Ignavibacteria bacterium]HMR41379.1 potassium-transporting ATPase subunit KdpC [Ignavibacteria bacterium]